MSEEADISRILFTIFDGLEPQKIDQYDVVRLWSLEMQWFSPEESQSVIDALSEAGWISRQDVTLYLSEGVKLEIPSLGWRPMTRRMLSPPIYNLTEKDRSGDSASDLSQPRVNAIKEIDNQSKNQESFSRPKVITENQGTKNDSSNKSIPIDRAEGSIPTLIELIASQSGLPNNEVVRRAQRKRRALGPVTLWMALALVAREQGLDMESVSSAIDKAAE
ncbi:MAG: DUF2240 family protein [Euryarchaeota archaeon]